MKGRADHHLSYMLGNDGMARMLSFIDVGEILDPAAEKLLRVNDVRNWTQTFRRLFIPHYEEARQLFGDAKANGFFAEAISESSPYCASTLKRIIEQYGGDE